MVRPAASEENKQLGLLFAKAVRFCAHSHAKVFHVVESVPHVADASTDVDASCLLSTIAWADRECA